MRRFLLLPVMLIALAVAGCANLTNAYNTVTGATVSPTAVYVARNSFDALEVTSTNYIVFCKRNPATYGCSREAINRLIPAVRAGRVARTNLTQFQKDHPGQLGTSGLYDALVASTNTLQGVVTQYNIVGVAR